MSDLSHERRPIAMISNRSEIASSSVYVLPFPALNTPGALPRCISLFLPLAWRRYSLMNPNARIALASVV